MTTSAVSNSKGLKIVSWQVQEPKIIEEYESHVGEKVIYIIRLAELSSEDLNKTWSVLVGTVEQISPEDVGYNWRHHHSRFHMAEIESILENATVQEAIDVADNYGVEKGYFRFYSADESAHIKRMKESSLKFSWQKQPDEIPAAALGFFEGMLRMSEKFSEEWAVLGYFPYADYAALFSILIDTGNTELVERMKKLLRLLIYSAEEYKEYIENTAPEERRFSLATFFSQDFKNEVSSFIEYIRGLDYSNAISWLSRGEGSDVLTDDYYRYNTREASQKQSWKVQKDKYKDSLENKLKELEERYKRYTDKSETFINNSIQKTVITRVKSRIKNKIESLRQQIEKLDKKRNIFSSDDPSFDDYDDRDPERKRNDFFFYDKDKPGGDDALHQQEIWNTDLMYLEDTQRTQKERDAFDWTGRENLQIGFGSLKFAWQKQEEEYTLEEFLSVMKPGQVWKVNRGNSPYVYLHIGENAFYNKEYIHHARISINPAVYTKSVDMPIENDHAAVVAKDIEPFILVKEGKRKTSSLKFSWQIQGESFDNIYNVLNSARSSPRHIENTGIFYAIEHDVKVGSVTSLSDAYLYTLGVNNQIKDAAWEISLDNWWIDIDKNVKEKYDWISQIYSAGRSSGWLVVVPKEHNLVNHFLYGYQQGGVNWDTELNTQERMLLSQMTVDIPIMKEYIEEEKKKFAQQFESIEFWKDWVEIARDAGIVASLKFAWQKQEITEFSVKDYWPWREKNPDVFAAWIMKEAYGNSWYIAGNGGDRSPIVIKGNFSFEEARASARQTVEDRGGVYVISVWEEEYNETLSPFSSLKFSVDTYVDSSPAESNPVEESKLVNPIDDKHLRRTNPKRFDQRQDWYQETDSDISNRFDNAIQGDASLKFSWQVQYDEIEKEFWSKFKGRRAVFVFKDLNIEHNNWLVQTGIVYNVGFTESETLHRLNTYEAAKAYAMNWISDYNTSHIPGDAALYYRTVSERKESSLKLSWQIQNESRSISEGIAAFIIEDYKEQLDKLRYTFENYREEKESLSPNYFLNFDIFSDEVFESVVKHLPAYEKWAREMIKWKEFVLEIRGLTQDKIKQLYSEFIDSPTQESSSNSKGLKIFSWAKAG